MQDVNNRENLELGVMRVGTVYRNRLGILLNFSVNLKLLKEIKSMNLKNIFKNPKYTQ